MPLPETASLLVPGLCLHFFGGPPSEIITSVPFEVAMVTLEFAAALLCGVDTSAPAVITSLPALVALSSVLSFSV